MMLAKTASVALVALVAVAAIALTDGALAQAPVEERNTYYLTITKDDRAVAWEVFEPRTADWRDKLDAAKARLKAKHGVEPYVRVLLAGHCGFLYSTSDDPKYMNVKSFPDRKQQIEIAAAMQHNHRASRPYEVVLHDMRCNGDHPPAIKLGRPWATWKPAPQVPKIGAEDGEIVAYLWNQKGAVETWTGTRERWMSVRDAERIRMTRSLGLPENNDPVLLSRGECALKIDKPGEALRSPQKSGYFSALVEARELTDQGVGVTWVMCSDTHGGKAVVERW